MPIRFSVLASGSSGNSSLLESDGIGVLIDSGLGPRQLGYKMASFGATWKNVQAVLLTHTHSDHWKERTLAHLRRQRIPLYCHAGHQEQLESYSTAFTHLQQAGLVRPYEIDRELQLSPSLRCVPFSLCHDGGVTCGFRFEGSADLYGQPSTLAYAADLGCWQPELARILGDADVLALEFNHDVHMEKNSGRSPNLIARVLGDEGHLSNEQAAALLGESLRLTENGRLQHVVLLHLSRQCNKPSLAQDAARSVLGESHPHVLIHTANQDRPGPSILIGGSQTGRPRKGQARPARRQSRRALLSQPWLPGWEGEPTGMAE
jgi:phosphoribosyl 1,2-cyclic phosphodiesterase